MNRRTIGLTVVLVVLAGAAMGWAQTNLTVVRHSDNTLWKMTCQGISNCSAWTQISGGFSVQPTLTWDPVINKYLLVGIGNNLTSIWRGTFNADGTWNNDWTKITGASPSPVAIAAGNIGLESTVLIGPVGTATQNGTALLNALANITILAPSSTNPYLLKIEPGIYDIGTSSFQMLPYVDVEGSGESTTIITGSNSSGFGVVGGASNAEIRFLTVQSTGGGVAFYNNSTSPKMTNVTISVSGGTYSVGVENTSSSPMMTNVTVSASGGAGGTDYGVSNASSSPTMTNVKVSASGQAGGSTVYAIYNYSSSSPTMANVTASASGGTYNHGVHNDSSPSVPLLTMTNVTVSASGGTNSYNYGVFNTSSTLAMTNVTVSASASGGQQQYGIFNNSSTLTMTNGTVSASGGTSNCGVYCYGGTIRINHSVIKGSTNTISNASGTTTYVGNTQLDGGAVSSTGTLICAGVYDENYTFYAIACP